MSDEFLFGFDCDALQNDNANNPIPPAENELKPASTLESEEHAIHFVDARFYTEKAMDIFSQQMDISTLRNEESFRFSHTMTSQFIPSMDLDDIMDNLLEIADAFEPEFDNDYQINISETNRNSNSNLTTRSLTSFTGDIKKSASPSAIGIGSASNDPFHTICNSSVPYILPIEEEEKDDLIFSDSEFESDFSFDDEYNFEECGIGLDRRTLPFDFEKPLRWKPMSTVIVDLEVQHIQFAISRTLQHAFDSDDDDSHSSSSSGDDLSTNVPYVDDLSANDIVDQMVPTQESEPGFRRFLSDFDPPLYDIILMESSPLRIHGVDNINNINMISLEYLHCSLLDQDKLYSKLWQTLLRNSFSVRCGNLNGNINNIKRISNEGGCKILQFVGHCCNPISVAHSDNIYHDLTKHIANPLDEYYILLESDCVESIIDGEWIPITQLKQYFEGHMNDIVIVMSPQHIEMANVFLEMGFSYIIGIKTFPQNNTNTHNNLQILDFMHHFYSAILNQECLDRAFELAKTAIKSAQTDVKSKKEMAKITKKLQKLSGLILEKTKTDMDDDTEDEHDKRFILLTPHNDSRRFIVFSKLQRGEPIDAIGNMLTHTKYLTNWNGILMKPFIGRSIEVIHVYDALIKNKMILIGGRENDGRKSVLKRLISYLYQHNYFDDGLFVLDCKSELIHKKRHWKFCDILCFKLNQLGFDIKPALKRHSQLLPLSELTQAPMSVEHIHPIAGYMKSVSMRSTIRSSGLIPSTPSMDDIICAIQKYNICFVLFNVDCWDNDEIYHFMDEFASNNKNDKSQCIFTMQHGKHCDFYDDALPRLSYKMALSQIPTTLRKTPAESQLVDHISDHINVTVRQTQPNIGDIITLTERRSIVDELLSGPMEYGKSMLFEQDRNDTKRISWNFVQKDVNDIENNSFLKIFCDKHSSFEIVIINALNREYITELFVQLCYYDFDVHIVFKHDGIHELFDGSAGNVKRVSAFYQFLKQQDDIKISLDSIVTKLNTTHTGWMNDFHKTVPKFATYFRSTTVGSHLGSLRRVHQQLEQEIPEDLYYGKTILLEKPRKSKLPLKRLALSDRTTTPMIMEGIELEDTISIIDNAKTLDDLYPILEGIPFKELKRMILQHYDIYNKKEEAETKAVIVVDEYIYNKRKRKRKIEESVTELTSEYEDDDDDENQGFDSIWNTMANKNDIQYANLSDFQGPLSDKFYNITKLSKIELNERQIEIWFRCTTNASIDQNNNIFIRHFETFWKWFVSMCYIVADLYDLFYNIFYNKIDARKKLKNKDIGTFMFILGSKCNELIIIYITKTNEINELLLIYNKKHNIFKYIEDHKHLKHLMNTKNGIVDKKQLLQR